MKRTIVLMFCLAIIVLLLSTGVQAQELTEVSASEILQQIEKGEDIVLKNVRITGKLDLRNINLKNVSKARFAREIEYYGLEKELKIVESEIKIRNSFFEEDVDFSNTEFRKDIDFSGTFFPRKSDFSGANFARDARFTGAYFLGCASFNDANFADRAFFTEANFACNAYFNDSNFAGYAYFDDSNFARDAIFMDAKFARDAYFRDAKFAGPVLFNDANFTGRVHFNDANFTGYAHFNDANFAGYVIFMDANFTGRAIFMDANFARDVYFNDANFTGYVIFTDANFAGYAYFNDANFTGGLIFPRTEFDKISFTGTTFPYVSLNETDYNQMNVEWSTLKDALVFDGLTYIKLIKNFREREQFEDADAVYYQYRQFSQKNKEWSPSKLMDVVAGASCGYGIKPEYALIWGFILIIVFALVYKLGNGIKRLKIKENGDNRVSFWDAFYFSLVTFSTVGYGDWYPEDRYRKFVMIEGVLGWMLLALFIVTLANVMIRP